MWDLPGIGTDEFSKDTYWQKLDLKKYDVFLIFIATRFRHEISYLTDEIAKIGKKFFFVRSKIDHDVEDLKEDGDESPPSAEAENALLREIRRECSEKLGGRLSIEQRIYLISSRFTDKWEFEELTKAILDVLPEDLSECLTFSLDILKSLSAETLKCKVKALKRRIILVAGISATAAAIPIPGVSAAVDIGLIVRELTMYRSQLGLPSEGTSTYQMLTKNTQAKVKACLSLLELAGKGARWLAAYATEAAAEEGVRFIPIVGLAIAGAMSYGTTYYALKNSLEIMEEAAIAILEETAAQNSA